VVPGAAARVRTEVVGAMPALRAASRRFLAAQQPRACYVEYLVASHAVVRASVPLLHAALEQARASAGHDAVCASIVDYLEQHLVEEADHDEWLLEDLESIGVPRSVAVDRRPSAAVAALVGAQYYWIRHAHPVALLGYLAVLEGHPPTLAAIDQLMERTGYERRAFRTLIEHADIDQTHGEEVLQLIDALPWAPDLVDLVCSSAVHTVSGVAAVIGEVVDHVSAPARRDAARPRAARF
jgi:hypothetical protein